MKPMLESLFRIQFYKIFITCVEKDGKESLSKIAKKADVTYSYAAKILLYQMLPQGYFVKTVVGRESRFKPTQKAKDVYILLKKAEELLNKK